MSQRLSALLGARLQQDVSLAKYTVAQIGGHADWLFIMRPDDPPELLAQVLRAAWEHDIPTRMIGGGANILVSDKGVRGLVIINRVTQIDFGDWHDGRNVSASGGTALATLARQCAIHGIAGMAWAISVPGTVGGAVINNAGAHGADMAASVADIVVLTADEGVQLYSHADMAYDYRHSALKARKDKRFAVLQVNFILPHDDPDAIQNQMAEYKAYRKRTQPPGASLGSIFKNPPGDYAGRLIENCGLKGYHIGNVMVSPKHANFFINVGAATAQDYNALIQHVQQTVHQQTGIWLETEIECVGDWDLTNS